MPYKGRSTTSGNSRALAFEAAFFRSHPEFAEGEFEADVVAPGKVLVQRVPEPEAATEEEDDPVLRAYLGFLECQMEKHPEHIRPLSAALLEEARELVGHLEVNLDEELDDDLDWP